MFFRKIRIKKERKKAEAILEQAFKDYILVYSILDKSILNLDPSKIAKKAINDADAFSKTFEASAPFIALMSLSLFVEAGSNRTKDDFLLDLLFSASLDILRFMLESIYREYGSIDDFSSSFTAVAESNFIITATDTYKRYASKESRGEIECLYKKYAEGFNRR
jgi:hypothetical protein